MYCVYLNQWKEAWFEWEKLCSLSSLFLIPDSLSNGLRGLPDICFGVNGVGLCGVSFGVNGCSSVVEFSCSSELPF